MVIARDSPKVQNVENLGKTIRSENTLFHLFFGSYSPENGKGVYYISLISSNGLPHACSISIVFFGGLGFLFLSLLIHFTIHCLSSIVITPTGY